MVFLQGVVRGGSGVIGASERALTLVAHAVHWALTTVRVMGPLVLSFACVHTLESEHVLCLARSRPVVGDLNMGQREGRPLPFGLEKLRLGS